MWLAVLQPGTETGPHGSEAWNLLSGYILDIKSRVRSL